MTEQKQYVVRAKYANKFEFIFLESNELTVEKFMLNVVKTFNVRGNTITVRLTDNMNTPIRSEVFASIIKAQSIGSFFINVKCEAAPTDNIVLITPEMLKNFLIEAAGDYILLEHQENDSLTNNTRCALIRYMSELVTDLYGMTPTRDQKLMACKAAIYLFPSLRLKESGTDGTEILFNYISSRIKYIRQHARKSQRPIEEASNDDSDMEEQANNSSIVLDEALLKKDIDYLKNTVVNSSNLNSIKEKLISTKDLRMKMLTNKELDLMITFPYFFTHSELILFDYSIRYSDLDDNAFLHTWPSYSTKLRNILNLQYKSQCFATMWNQDVEGLLVLLKLFPAKKGREPFLKATQKLLVFRPNGTPFNELIENSNSHPYIIACGPSRDEITHYFIEVEKQLINVPNGFEEMKTFDLFFKVHKVFNLEFDNNIKPMMNFMQHFIYKFNDQTVKPTTRMFDVFNKLN